MPAAFVIRRLLRGRCATVPVVAAVPASAAWTAILVCACGIGLAHAQEGERPNILWITAEDMGVHLGCYGDSYAVTPHLDGFAREGVRYTRAFATAPVCSPARSTLITGCHATSLGTQRLRSAFPLPDLIRGFPEYLRDAGYFTSNNVKTDYNIADEAAFIARTWNRNAADAHWRQRPGPASPFFSVFNLMTTHQSRTNVWPWEQFEKEVGSRLSQGGRHVPAAAPIPPFYPDTPLVRRTLARYHDCVTAMDGEVGALLAQLREDGLEDSTIVFFFSDHGMGMPRGKRVLHDSGMQVPLLIRFPDKWAHLSPVPPGQGIGRLVSFVDFAPTVLSIAGVPIPGHMQGRAFLGARAAEPRQYVFGARDRVDEVFDLSRSIRDDRWLLIRNFMPHLSWMQPERFSDNAEMRREMRKLADLGQLNAAQWTYAAPQRAPLELYDTRDDPFQIRNLADDPAHAERIQAMSDELRRWSLMHRDLGFFMEPETWDAIGNGTPREWVRAMTDEQLSVLHAAMAGTGERAGPMLEHPMSMVRYWSVIGLYGAALAGDGEMRARLRERLADPSVSVRIEAAGLLATVGDPAASLTLLARELQHPQVEARLHAMRTLELLGETARPLTAAIEAARREALRNPDSHPCWMFVQFSAEAALERLGREPE